MTAEEQPLDAECRRAVAYTWEYRAWAERESELRFARLAARLREAGAAPVVVEMAERASCDERRHSELCARTAELYGSAQRSWRIPSPQEIAPPSWTLRDRALYEVVAFCCITETINAALLTTLLEEVRVPAIRGALLELLRDEVEHGRLGWAHLAAERAQGHGAFLGRVLPQMLEGTVSDELFHAHPEPASEALRAHGNVAAQVRIEIFVQALSEVVFPGLEAHGVDTAAARAWLEQRLAAREAGG